MSKVSTTLASLSPRLAFTGPRLPLRASSAILRCQPRAHTVAKPRTNLPSSRSFHQTYVRTQADFASETGERSTLLSEFSLQGKVIIVSGGGRGLGLTQAEAALEAGAVVHVIDILPPPTPDSDFTKVANRATSEFGSRLEYHHLDVRDVEKLNATIQAVVDKEGRIDGLIAAAGIQQETPALEYSLEDADKMFGVNITGVFMTAQAVARQMVKLKTPGSLVLIASMSGTVANRGLICPAYNASKAGVIQLARNLAAEWGAHGIRVNTISPGYIVTAMTAGLFDAFPERRTDWPNANMLNRLSYPEEYRGAAVFLLSNASSFMTGADLRIDGGHCAW